MSRFLQPLLFLRRLLSFAWCVLGVLVLGWIVWRNLPPSGEISVSARTGEPNGFVGGFTPLDRATPVQENGLWYSDLVGEPVYFHLAAPRLYGAMRVRLRYKQEGQSLIGLGIRTDPATWSFDVKPIDLPFLDEAGWASRQEGELRLYERTPTNRSAQALLKSGERIAVLGIDPARWGLRLPALRQDYPIEIPMHETGSHRFYVYVQEGPLHVSLGLRGPVGAETRVALVREGKTLLTRTLSGDGAIELLLTGAEPGVYRIDLDAPDAVSLVGLASKHARIVLRDAAEGTLRAPAGAVFFNPEFPVVSWETHLKEAPYDAVITRYQPPRLEADGWRIAEAEFDLSFVRASQGRVQMAVSLPAVKTAGGKVRVDRVEVTYVRPRFTWQAFKELFKMPL